MKYFLDFDGVIFDIEGFKVRMKELGFADAHRNASLFDTMQAKDKEFVVSSFVFPDALTFLRAHKNDCYVVSSYVSSNPLYTQDEHEACAYQTEKIVRAGIAELLGRDRIHVVGASKQEALRALYEAAEEKCMFIDDREVYVREALALGMHAVLMDRTVRGEKTDLDCITSFADLTHNTHT